VHRRSPWISARNSAVTLKSFLQRVISILAEAEVPYLLTGPLAAAYYAVPRATQDTDLVVEVIAADLPGLTALLSSFGFYVFLAAAREASAQDAAQCH